MPISWQTFDWQTFSLTLQLAATVSFALVLLGCRSPSRVGAGKFLVEAAVGLPIVLPPTVLGFYVLVALGPHSPIGRWWISLTGHPLAFTFSGLVIGSILYSLPFAVQPFAASFGANQTALLLLVLCFGLLSIVYGLNRKAWLIHPVK